MKCCVIDWQACIYTYQINLKIYLLISAQLRIVRCVYVRDSNLETLLETQNGYIAWDLSFSWVPPVKTLWKFDQSQSITFISCKIYYPLTLLLSGEAGLSQSVHWLWGGGSRERWSRGLVYASGVIILTLPKRSAILWDPPSFLVNA